MQTYNFEISDKETAKKIKAMLAQSQNVKIKKTVKQEKPVEDQPFSYGSPSLKTKPIDIVQPKKRKRMTKEEKELKKKIEHLNNKNK